MESPTVSFFSESWPYTLTQTCTTRRKRTPDPLTETLLTAGTREKALTTHSL